VNSVGLRRRGFTDEKVREIEDFYRILYVQNNNVSNGIKAIKESMPASPTRDMILSFIEESDKGIIRGMI
jgi:UDP-N-acetylglucosamine acyltransferase